jgi:LacI family transcriptional regulator
MTADHGGRPVTLSDIARELRITKMAVSKALRGHRDISEATRRRVLERAHELGYVPNSTSRSLRFHRSHLVGIVVPSFMYSFFSEMLEGANSVLEAAGYQSVLTVSGEDRGREARQIEALISRQVEGLIVVSCQRRDEFGIFERLKQRNMPFVIAGRRIEGLDTCFVGVDNFALGRLVTGHLIKGGRRRIAHLCGPDNMTSVLRLQGYQAALSASRLPLRQDFIVASAGQHEAVRALLRRSGRPDAIFAYNDLAALEAFRIIQSAGLRVPQDVALAGVGNNRYSDLLSTPLTTVDQHPQTMGEKAARLLLKWLEEKQTPQKHDVCLRARLIVRESSIG